jgi:hypothetical protein
MRSTKIQMETRRDSRSGTGRRENRHQQTAVLDLTLVREVQMRATGANIHALSQQLQIYVSAFECGAVLNAQAAEASLRSWLAASR